MTPVPLQNLARPQLDRLARFSAEACVDIHCHCLPGIDDGAQTISDSIKLCKALVADGITTVVATPHQLGSYEGTNSGLVVRQLVDQLQTALLGENVPLTVRPGGDVRVDVRMVDLLLAGEVLTLANGPYVLLELPHEALIDLRRPITLLAQKGFRSILSHPERHEGVAHQMNVLLPWIDAGLLLQVTAGSLLGQFGALAEKVGWQMVEAGMVSIIASDAHNTEDRPPSMTRAIDAIAKRSGHAMTRKMCIDNPVRVLQGTDIAAVRLSPNSRQIRSWGRSS